MWESIIRNLHKEMKKKNILLKYQLTILKKALDVQTKSIDQKFVRMLNDRNLRLERI